MEENPFPDLKIECSKFLDTVKGRSKCSKCSRSRKYFCYTCYLPTPDLADRVPSVKLPVKVDIIKHPSEVDGKSTAVHAGVIAPDDVTIYTYPVIPDYIDKERVAVVFPSADSLTLEQLADKYNASRITDGSGKRKRDDSNEHSETCHKSVKLDQADLRTDAVGQAEIDNHKHIEGDDIAVKHVPSDSPDTTDTTNLDGVNGPQNDDWFLERVIFIDSTWNQTRSICADERLKDIQCLQLSDRKTKFWRHHKDNPDTYLSTIEAIYYLVYDYHKIFVDTRYCGEYDNLLFFFRYMYSKIRTMYDGGENLLAYKNRKDKGSDKIRCDARPYITAHLGSVEHLD